MGNESLKAPKQIVHIKSTGPSPSDRRDATENRMESALQKGFGGLARYKLMEKMHQEEASGQAQERMKARATLGEKFATLGEIARVRTQPTGVPTERSVKLHRYGVVYVTAAEAREMVSQFQKAIEAGVQERRERVESMEELAEVMKDNEVWVDDIRSHLSGALQTIVDGLRIGYREPESGRYRVGTPAIGALFRHLCM